LYYGAINDFVSPTHFIYLNIALIILMQSAAASLPTTNKTFITHLIVYIMGPFVPM